MTLREDLKRTINRHSRENGSNTPDFLLAEFLERCLDAFDSSVRERDRWYGVRLRAGAPSHFVDEDGVPEERASRATKFAEKDACVERVLPRRDV